MSRKHSHPKPKAILRLPDLDQAKSAVLNSLMSADAPLVFNSIDDFCKEHETDDATLRVMRVI
jgi:hypothetical protein